MQKPTQEEITNYLTLEKNYDDFTAMAFADRFWDYYQSIGWKVGKHDMKDWKAAVRTWERNNKKYETNQRAIAGSPKAGTSEARIDRAKKW